MSPRMFSNLTTPPQEITLLDLINCPENIQELYRGFADIPDLMFCLPTILGGIFGRYFPNTITINEIVTHKIVNNTKNFYFVGMSEGEAEARLRGNDNFITIDPTLFRHFIVDVHKSCKKHLVNIPARMDKECEQAALVVLYCCIKNITIDNIKIDNPFYLPINRENKAAILDFANIYKRYLALLKMKYDGSLSLQAEHDGLKEFLISYQKFYADYDTTNPFTMSIAKLTENYPDFMAKFSQNNRSLTSHTQKPLEFFTNYPTFAELTTPEAKNIFSQHAYTKDLVPGGRFDDKEAEDCYEDPWASPVYD